MRFLYVLTILLLSSNVAFSADGESYFYKGASLSSTPTHLQLKSNDLWLKNSAFNWKVLPNLNVDVNIGYGYFDTENTPPTHSSVSRSNSSMTPNYQGLFGAALIKKSVDKIGTVYAKGGLNWINTTEPQLVNTALYDITPYLSVGANIPAPLQKNLELNVELSYQNLQLEEPDAIFTMGAKYRF